MSDRCEKQLEIAGLDLVERVRSSTQASQLNQELEVLSCCKVQRMGFLASESFVHHTFGTWLSRQQSQIDRSSYYVARFVSVDTGKLGTVVDGESFPLQRELSTCSSPQQADSATALR